MEEHATGALAQAPRSPAQCHKTLASLTGARQRWMKRGHYGNPWRLKLRLTSASAVTPGGFPPRPAAGSGQK